MTATYAYRLLPSCVDHQGHLFTSVPDYPDRSICRRCGVQVDATNNVSPDPTEPRTLFPLKISEALQDWTTRLTIFRARDGIYWAELGITNRAVSVQASGTSLAQALTNLAMKLSGIISITPIEGDTTE